MLKPKQKIQHRKGLWIPSGNWYLNRMSRWAHTIRSRKGKNPDKWYSYSLHIKKKKIWSQDRVGISNHETWKDQIVFHNEFIYVLPTPEFKSCDVECFSEVWVQTQCGVGVVPRDRVLPVPAAAPLRESSGSSEALRDCQRSLQDGCWLSFERPRAHFRTCLTRLRLSHLLLVQNKVVRHSREWILLVPEPWALLLGRAHLVEGEEKGKRRQRGVRVVLLLPGAPKSKWRRTKSPRRGERSERTRRSGRSHRPGVLLLLFLHLGTESLRGIGIELDPIPTWRTSECTAQQPSTLKRKIENIVEKDSVKRPEGHVQGHLPGHLSVVGSPLGVSIEDPKELRTEKEAELGEKAAGTRNGAQSGTLEETGCQRSSPPGQTETEKVPEVWSKAAKEEKESSRGTSSGRERSRGEVEEGRGGNFEFGSPRMFGARPADGCRGGQPHAGQGPSSLSYHYGRGHPSRSEDPGGPSGHYQRRGASCSYQWGGLHPAPLPTGVRRDGHGGGLDPLSPSPVGEGCDGRARMDFQPQTRSAPSGLGKRRVSQLEEGGRSHSQSSRHKGKEQFEERKSWEREEGGREEEEEKEEGEEQVSQATTERSVFGRFQEGFKVPQEDLSKGCHQRTEGFVRGHRSGPKGPSSAPLEAESYEVGEEEDFEEGRGIRLLEQREPEWQDGSRGARGVVWGECQGSLGSGSLPWHSGYGKSGGYAFKPVAGGWRDRGSGGAEAYGPVILSGQFVEEDQWSTGPRSVNPLHGSRLLATRSGSRSNR